MGLSSRVSCNHILLPRLAIAFREGGRLQCLCSGQSKRKDRCCELNKVDFVRQVRLDPRP